MIRWYTFLSVMVVSFAMSSISLVYAQEDGEQPAQALNSTTVNQLNALASEKASRTEAQKIDSNLIYAGKERAGDPMMKNLPAFKHNIEIDENGLTLVDIKATVSPGLLQEIEDLGGTVINSFVQYDAIRARMPLDQLETLAENPDVRFIRKAVKAILNKTNTSEGDAAHSAASARSSYSIDGSGVKVGVLSDSVDYLAAVQATGDLPAVTVLEDAPGYSGEGTAMLEIVHDLAPGAELYFATAWMSAAGFASNILALEAAGCDVIVDDVGYFNESPFQDDIISQAVNSVTANGVLYFSSAGNAGNLNDGTSHVWEGDYLASTSVPGTLLHSTVHDFGGGDVTNGITSNTSLVSFNLFWADPLGGASNDYDLYLLDAGGNIAAASDAIQDGDDDPYESISGSGNTNGYQLVVARWSGVDRFIHLTSSMDGVPEHVTAGQIRGHAAAEDGFGVAAVSAAGKTTPFTGSESVETFSSDGPRRVFYEADGTPITSGNFSSTGGMVRQKPDIAAADGVQTATPGFDPFYGTSAAAPHAAALGALMLARKPGVTINEVRTVFNTTALDIEAAGFDRDSGAGIIMADTLQGSLSTFPWTMFMPAFAGGGGGSTTPEPPQWGAGSDVCCQSSSATFSLSSSGVTKKSYVADCSTAPTWEGWQATTPGNKSFSWVLSSTGCGSYSGSFNYTLEEDNTYFFQIEVDGTDLVVYVYINAIRSAGPGEKEADQSTAKTAAEIKASMQLVGKIQLNIPQGAFSRSNCEIAR